jgi:hypothetical protein
VKALVSLRSAHSLSYMICDCLPTGQEFVTGVGAPWVAFLHARILQEMLLPLAIRRSGRSSRCVSRGIGAYIARR